MSKVLRCTEMTCLKRYGYTAMFFSIFFFFFVGGGGGLPVCFPGQQRLFKIKSVLKGKALLPWGEGEKLTRFKV